MSDWRNSVTEERPSFGLGDLEEGDEIEGTFLDEGHMVETRHGDALEIGFAVASVPESYEDMNGQTVEEGEDYNIMTSSSRFMYALKEFGEDLTGISATISADGEGFDRTYYVQ